MVREIGGYFELEMPRLSGAVHPNGSAILKSGRACLSLLTDVTSPARVWVPFYICGGALEPIAARGTDIRFYEIDERFEPVEPLPELQHDERLLYVNYFGLKAACVEGLERRYGDRLWVDNVQAFYFAPDFPRAWHFNSARKFFGVPDGAYLYEPSGSDLIAGLTLQPNTRYRVEHLLHRLDGRVHDGRAAFEHNEALTGEGIEAVSRLGAAILDRIDYVSVADRRRGNFDLVHAALGSFNRIDAGLLSLGAGVVPFAYPFLPAERIEHERLWEHRVYVPRLWQDCVTRADTGFTWERRLSTEMLVLPIDQRYDAGDMEHMVSLIRNMMDRG